MVQEVYVILRSGEIMTIVGRVSRNRVMNAFVFFPIDYALSCFFRIIVYGYLPIEMCRYVFFLLAVLCGYFVYTSSVFALYLFVTYLFVSCFWFSLTERRYVLSYGIALFLFGDRYEDRAWFFLYIFMVVMVFVRVLV